MPARRVEARPHRSPDPNQPRKHFDLTDLKALAASMSQRGQLQPIGVRPDGTLLWGDAGTGRPCSAG